MVGPQFLDIKTQANIGELAFGLRPNGTIIYGVIRAIEGRKAAFGYGNDLIWLGEIYKHYPDFRKKIDLFNYNH